MASNAEWTGAWVAQKLKGETEVERASIESPQRLHVIRKQLPPFFVGTTAVTRFDAPSLEPLLTADPLPAFVVNVPKESYAVASALSLAKQRNIALGGLGDLIRALGLADVRTYVSPEIGFLERGLNQHDKVSGFERVDDRLYKIERTGLRTLTVVFLNPYELTADHVRTARERYGKFDTLVITNPNGGTTSSAEQVADELGCKIFQWREFFGRLNKR